MTINIKNFLKDKTKLSKMGEFQNLKQIEGLEMASISAERLGISALHVRAEKFSAINIPSSCLGILIPKA